MRCLNTTGVRLVKESGAKSGDVLPSDPTTGAEGMAGQLQALANELGRKRADQIWHKALFLHDFCRQTWAASESSGPVQPLSSRLALGEAEGTRACVWKRLCRCYQSWPRSKGCPCTQTEVPIILQSLPWWQVWLDSLQQIKSLKYSTSCVKSRGDQLCLSLSFNG